MSDNEQRADFRTRFQKGLSGNPKGRPKKTISEADLFRDALFKNIRIKEGDGYRTVPKIIAATEVCLNNALKGDVGAFRWLMTFVEKNKLMPPTLPTPKFVEVRYTIVDPKDTKTDDNDESNAS